MDQTPQIGFGTRLWFAWVCFFRVLFDGAFANRAWSVTHALPAAPQKEPDEPKVIEKVVEKIVEKVVVEKEATTDAALQLLSLLQREGRFIDFLEEDLTTASDADIGAAARVVHQGCRKALHDHGKVVPVRTEEEGSKITVAAGTSPTTVKLVGNVGGKPPFTGQLRHRGWRIEEMQLPTAIDGHDVRVIAPAEVEL